MARRRRRARENPSAGVWIALGLVGAVGAGVGIYYLTKPKVATATPTTINPSTGQPVTPAQQAQINAQLAQLIAQGNAQAANLLNQGAQQNAANPDDTSGTDTSGSGIPSTGVPQVDNAVNQAASQLGF